MNWYKQTDGTKREMKIPKSQRDSRNLIVGKKFAEKKEVKLKLPGDRPTSQNSGGLNSSRLSQGGNTSRGGNNSRLSQGSSGMNTSKIAKGNSTSQTSKGLNTGRLTPKPQTQVDHQKET